MIEFQVVRCTCGGVVMDEMAFRGLIRSRCPKCRLRVWVQGDGRNVSVIRRDKRPGTLAT